MRLPALCLPIVTRFFLCALKLPSVSALYLLGRASFLWLLLMLNHVSAYGNRKSVPYHCQQQPSRGAGKSLTRVTLSSDSRYRDLFTRSSTTTRRQWNPRAIDMGKKLLPRSTRSTQQDSLIACGARSLTRPGQFRSIRSPRVDIHGGTPSVYDRPQTIVPASIYQQP